MNINEAKKYVKKSAIVILYFPKALNTAKEKLVFVELFNTN